MLTVGDTKAISIK